MISQKISKNIFWIFFELKNINLDNIGIFEKKVIFWKKWSERHLKYLRNLNKKKTNFWKWKKMKKVIGETFETFEKFEKKLLEMKKMTWNNTRYLTPFMQSHKTLHKERGSYCYTYTVYETSIWKIGNFKRITWSHWILKTLHSQYN